MTNSLQAALDQIKHSAEKVSSPIYSRKDGTVFVGVHLLPDLHKQLRILGAEEDKKQNVLLLEALSLLFAKYGKQI